MTWGWRFNTILIPATERPVGAVLDDHKSFHKNLVLQYQPFPPFDEPSLAARLMELAGKAREDLGDLGHRGKGQRKRGYVEDPQPSSWIDATSTYLHKYSLSSILGHASSTRRS